MRVSDKARLRRQDFWTAIALIVASLFFLAKTAQIPFFKADAAGVEAGKWYNSAALVPYGIFVGILVLAIALLVTAIRQGGMPRRGLVADIAAWATGMAGTRVLAAAAIMLAYIFALAPRVDFVICSALVVCALIYGFHETRGRATFIALVSVVVPSSYALIANFPQSSWSVPHDDDWVALAFFILLSIAMMVEVRAARGSIGGYLRVTPAIAVLVPLLLVIAMAFGFRQNVPNRTGLIFKQIEYHYYVTVKPWLAGKDAK